MKILHLLYESLEDSFGIGGVGIRAYKIAEHLRPRHEITFLCKRYPGARDRTIRGFPHVFRGTESESLTKTLVSYAAGCRHFVREHGAGWDVIIEEFSPGVPTFLSDLDCRRPIVLQLQSYYGTQYFRKYNPATAAVLYSLERLRPRRYHNVLVVNERLLSRYRMDGRGRSVAIIGNGVDEELLGIDSRLGRDVVFLGRLDVHNKGLDVLLQAFGLLSASHPETRLVIAGAGRDASRFHGLVGALPEAVRDRVVLVGWVEGERKSRLLEEARVVVLPSRYEAQPITTLEAMAAARPLVVSPIDELGYVPGGGAGIAMEDFSPGALAAAVGRLIDDEPLAREMGSRGRAAARNHTWEQVAARVEAFLERVTELSR